jgi:ABC-type sugar transport system ATPase subunit
MFRHNGSGKSTFVKLLAGYHEPDPGAWRPLGTAVLARSSSCGRARWIAVAATEYSRSIRDCPLANHGRPAITSQRHR